jgi:hypothetical protein
MVEGFGIGVLEAFACSKPVLGSAIGALRELISDGIDGYLVDPTSVTDWGNRMVSLFEKPERTRQMGVIGRQSGRQIRHRPGDRHDGTPLRISERRGGHKSYSDSPTNLKRKLSRRHEFLPTW